MFIYASITSQLSMKALYNSITLSCRKHRQARCRYPWIALAIWSNDAKVRWTHPCAFWMGKPLPIVGSYMLIRYPLEKPFTHAFASVHIVVCSHFQKYVVVALLHILISLQLNSRLCTVVVRILIDPVFHILVVLGEFRILAQNSYYWHRYKVIFL